MRESVGLQRQKQSSLKAVSTKLEEPQAGHDHFPAPDMGHDTQLEVAPAPRFDHGLSRIAVHHHARPGSMQHQLRVSHPDDPSELEADRIADQVMRMPDPGAPRIHASADDVQRKCAACAMGNEEHVHREARDGSELTGDTGQAVQSQLSELRSQGGQALPDSTKSFMEQRFGHDFSNVRIHDGTLASRTAASLNSRAFTIGSDVVFAQGEYSPQSDSGRRLLAHELTHVVQQGQAAPSENS